jgi:hypothetical protein
MLRTVDGYEGFAPLTLDDGARFLLPDSLPLAAPLRYLPPDAIEPPVDSGPVLMPPPRPPPEPPQADFARRLHAADPSQAARYEYGPVLPGAADDSRMHPVDQGRSNACGTSSLAMIMGYLGRPVPREDIDRVVRRTNFGATPGPLIEYARDHGLEAQGYNNGTWEEMKSLIERGIPVQAIYNTKASGDPADGHIVAVVGFRINKDTGQEEILFRNSNNGGAIESMSRSDFEHLWGNHFGYHNFFIAYAPEGTGLPPGRWDGVEALNGLASGLSNLSNDFDRIVSPDDAGDFIHGVVGLPGAVKHVVAGAGGYLVQTAGQWLRDEAGQVPVLGAVTRPLGNLVSGIGAGFADVWNGIGNAWDELGGAFGALARGDLRGFADGLWDGAKSYVGGWLNGIVSVGKGLFGAAVDVGNTLIETGKDIGDAIVQGAKTVGNAIGSGVKAIGNFLGF